MRRQGNVEWIVLMQRVLGYIRVLGIWMGLE